MDQGAEFIKDQLSQGRTADQVKDLLRGNGWQEPQIEAAFTALQSVATPPVPVPVPIQQKAPSVSPVPDSIAKKTPKDSGINPQAEVATLATTEPKKWLLPVVLAFITLIVLGGGGYWVYQKYLASKTSTENPIVTTPAPTTQLYSDANVTFSYPIAWKYSTANELSGGTDTKSTDLYFFTAGNWTKAQQIITDSKTNPPADLGEALLKLGRVFGYSIFNINFTSNVTAAGCPTELATGVTTDCVPFTSDKSASSSIETFLKTTYGTDGSAHFDSSATVDPSLIKTTTISGVTGYWGVNGPVGQQSVELAVPTTLGAEIFSFEGVTDIANLQGEVLAVYKSIKAL